MAGHGPDGSARIRLMMTPLNNLCTTNAYQSTVEVRNAERVLQPIGCRVLYNNKAHPHSMNESSERTRRSVLTLEVFSTFCDRLAHAELTGTSTVYVALGSISDGSSPIAEQRTDPGMQVNVALECSHTLRGST